YPWACYGCYLRFGPWIPAHATRVRNDGDLNGCSYIHGNLSRSTLPPVMMTPTRWPANNCVCLKTAATATAEEGSMTSFMRFQTKRMASIISSSDTSRMSLTTVEMKCHV